MDEREGHVAEERFPGEPEHDRAVLADRPEHAQLLEVRVRFAEDVDAPVLELIEMVGHLLGGWTIAPIFTAGSGLPMTLGTVNGGGQAFGEGDSVNFFGYGNSENAIPITPFTKEGSRYSTCGSGGIGTSSDFCQNIFANPQAAWMNVRQPILGFDTHDGGWGIPRGMPYWNVDLQLRKQFNITERVNTEFQVIFLNVFNHDQFLDPSGDYLDTSNPAGWGTLPGQNSSPWSPRSMEFGVRVNF